MDIFQGYLSIYGLCFAIFSIYISGQFSTILILSFSIIYCRLYTKIKKVVKIKKYLYKNNETIFFPLIIGDDIFIVITKRKVQFFSLIILNRSLVFLHPIAVQYADNLFFVRRFKFLVFIKGLN